MDHGIRTISVCFGGGQSGFAPGHVAIVLAIRVLSAPAFETPAVRVNPGYVGGCRYVHLVAHSWRRKRDKPCGVEWPWVKTFFLPRRYLVGWNVQAIDSRLFDDVCRG